ANRAVVIDLIAAKRAEGVAMLGIFHDEEVRAAVADRIVDVSAFRPAAAESDVGRHDADTARV
ncbi:MAG TPA: hypothetical protein VMP03_17105, partial [Methylomirabilota bacterium]|nr:hypothetical protein [Methylomirabilota bacterium]